MANAKTTDAKTNATHTPPATGIRSSWRVMPSPSSWFQAAPRRVQNFLSPRSETCQAISAVCPFKGPAWRPPPPHVSGREERCGRRERDGFSRPVFEWKADPGARTRLLSVQKPCALRPSIAPTE
jgi:hypothetical protein